MPVLNTAITEEAERAQSALDHSLRPHFPELEKFNSTRELEASPLYARLRPEIERVLESVVHEDFAPAAPPARAPAVRATAWNIERGMRLDSIISVLRDHPEMGQSDLLLLTELDYGMARSGNRFVAREIAEGFSSTTSSRRATST